MSAVALKVRGETPLASRPIEDQGLKAGDRWCVDGVVIKYRNQDIAALEEKFEATFFNDFIQRAAHSLISQKEIWEYVDAGTKKDGAPYIVPDDVKDELPIHDVIDVVFEALCRSYRGMSSDEFMAVMFGQNTKDGDVEVSDLPPSETPTTTTSQT